MRAAPKPTACLKRLHVRAAALRRWPVLLAILAALLATRSAIADQRDGRLAELFTQLHSADTSDTAAPIEAQIWGIWLQSGNEKVDSLMAAGVAGLSDNDLDGALTVFSQIVALAPEFAEGWNKRATTLFLMGRCAESIQDIDRVLALEPRHFGALSGLGLCDVQLDKDQAAVDAFERALAVDPNLNGVRHNIEELKKQIARHSI